MGTADFITIGFIVVLVLALAFLLLYQEMEKRKRNKTLEQIAKIYQVPLASLIEDNAVKSAELSDRRAIVNKLAVVLISASIVWLFAMSISTKAVVVSSVLMSSLRRWLLWHASMPASAISMSNFVSNYYKNIVGQNTKNSI